jgi:hypothetical protein
MDTIACPKCGTENPPSAMNCSHCRINLRFALDHPEEIQAAKLDATWPEGESSAQHASPGRRASTLARVILGLLSLVIGTVAIIPLFVIGEGTGSGIAAYAIASLTFAILAYGLSKADPEAWWAYATLVCGPLTLLSLSSGAADYFLAAIVMISITMAGAYFGTKSFRMPQPPPDLPSSE